jgi:copper chaperone
VSKVNVKGMSCQNCVQSVREAVEKVDGTRNVRVDLQGGSVDFEEEYPVDIAQVKKEIEKTGFEVADS